MKKTANQYIAEVIIPGPPVGMPRPRFNQQSGHTYMPSECKQYKQEFAIQTGNKFRETLMNLYQKKHKLKFTVLFYFKDRRNPDPDNCLKLVLDAIQDVTGINDKNYVADYDYHHTDPENPRTEIYVWSAKHYT